VLKGDATLMLRKETLDARKTRPTRQRAAVSDLPAEALVRFEALRAWRAETARSHGVPAYVIFHDATLREVALSCPQSLDDLAHISGVGARKRDAYGEQLLESIRSA